MDKTFYYKDDKIENGSYFQFPKALMGNERYRSLSNNAKLAYMLIRSRVSLSLANNWTDENERVYVIYTSKELQSELDVSERTVTTILEQLVQCGLIEIKKRGQGKPNMMFVKKVDENVQGRNFCESRPSKNEALEPKKTENLDPQKTRVNNKRLNKEENDLLLFSDAKIKKSNLEDWEKIVKNHIDYDSLIAELPQEQAIIDNIVLTMRNVLCSRKETVKVQSEYYDINHVKETLLKLKREHVETILHNFKIAQNNGFVHPNYLLTALYNSYSTYACQTNFIYNAKEKKGNERFSCYDALVR